MSYESNEMADYAKEIRDLPFKIMPGEDSSLRSSIFLERAIVSERIRLAMGLSLRPVTESVSATEDLEHSVIADKYYEPPLINVIKFACNKCPEKIIKVTSMCQAPCTSRAWTASCSIRTALPGGLPQKGNQLPQWPQSH